MTAVLLTGMSGAGKSTALAALAGLGFETVDTDDPGWIEVVGGERMWREPLIRERIDAARDGPLFMSGTVINQGRLADHFDAIVLLTAPRDVLLQRIEHRTTNRFGKAAEERAAVIRDIAEVEPLLRAIASHVIDATVPVTEVVARLVEIAAAAADPRLPT